MASEKLETILLYLKSEEDGARAIALKQFCELFKGEKFSSDSLKEMISFLDSEMEDEKSPIRTEVFQAACTIGSRDPKLIEQLVPAIKAELASGNRFRIEHVMRFLSEQAASDLDFMEDLVGEVIDKGPKLFGRRYLVPYLRNFYDRATGKSIKFLKKYKDRIMANMDAFNGDMQDIKELLEKRIEEHETLLRKEQERIEEMKRLQAEQERKRLEEEKRRKQLIEERRGLISGVADAMSDVSARAMEQPSPGEEGSLEVPAGSAGAGEDISSTAPGVSRASGTPDAGTTPSTGEMAGSGAGIGGDSENQDAGNVKAASREGDDKGDEAPFNTFTSLGLKRKEIWDD